MRYKCTQCGQGGADNYNHIHKPAYNCHNCKSKHSMIPEGELNMINICENCCMAYNSKLDECPECGEPKMKECFACKKLIDPINQLEYKGAYYHDSCLMNGKPVAQDMNHNELSGIHDSKPINQPAAQDSDRELIKLRAEVDYYQKELAKAHELLGRVTHQLSERWDNVRLTKFYPTDNLHNKRTINNPTGKK